MGAVQGDDTGKAARDSDDTRDRLMTAAVELFAQNGFQGASIRDLARETGMSLAGLYHHFCSKDELLFEIQRDAFARLMLPLPDILREPEVERRLERFVHNHLDFFTQHVTEMKVLSHELEALGGEMGQTIARMRADYFTAGLGIVSDLLDDRGRDDLDPRVATMALFGMINWIYRWYRKDLERSADDLARQILTIFLDGIRAGARNAASRS